MSWLGAAGALAAALAVLVVPGAVVGRILRLRAFTIAALAAPLSLAAIGLASVVAIVVPLRWSVWAWLGSVVLFVVLAAVVRLLVRRFDPVAAPEPARADAAWVRRAPWIAAAGAALLLLPRLVVVFGAPDAISQTFDNIYHLNAVRFILDESVIAPTQQLIPGFYPSLWHAAAATVALVSGASIPVAVTAVSLVLSGVVWPLGCVLLARQVAGRRPVAVIAAGIVAASLPAFPLLMLDFGVLYPNVLSISLLPAVLALLLGVARIAPDDGGGAPTRWVLLLAGVATLALAHPSTLMALFWIGVWPASAGLWMWLVRSRAAGRSLVVIAAGVLAWLAGATAAGTLIVLARPTEAQAFWLPSMSGREALLQTVTNGFVGGPANVAVSVAALAGVLTIVLRARRHWWLICAWLTLIVIYVVGAADPIVGIRYLLTGTWYSDIFRIAALFPVVVVPLAAIGVSSVVGLIVAALPRRATIRVVTAAAAVAAVAVAAQLSPGLQAGTATARTIYATTPSSPLLTTDELALIERLPDEVPAGDVIVGSPWTGASLSYALADRVALIPHIYADLDNVLPPDTALIVDGLNRADEDPAVCAAVERTRARWVLDFGTREIHGGHRVYPGLTELDESPALELVDEQGPQARLYRVTACG